jgi:bifunctional non-homologous end joining protein LigD
MPAPLRRPTFLIAAVGAHRAEHSCDIPPERQRCPCGTGWLHEIKHNGHRVAVITDGQGSAVLRSRNGYNVTHRFGAAIGGLAELGRAMILDGEIAAPDEKGVTPLDGLNEAIDGRLPERLAYFAFDLLHLDGYDLRNCWLEERTAPLGAVLLSAGAPRVGYAACGRRWIGFPRCSLRGWRRGRCLQAPRQPLSLRSARGRAEPKRHEIGDFIVTAFEEIAPGELEALHVAEEIASELRPCGQIRIGCRAARCGRISTC